MAWTTPRTWVVGEVVTAANMNTHVRDNLNAVFNAAAVTGAPSDPTGTTSTSNVMMGLAISATPAITAKMFASISGTIKNNSANACSYHIRYGTGTAPTNGAAQTGTAMTAPTTADLWVGGGGILPGRTVPFTAGPGLVTGLTAGTTYWFDLALATVTAGTAVVTNLTYTCMEVA